jgi:hypothetical protein
LVLFAGIMIMIAGALNSIWGIAAVSNSKFFTHNATYILTELNTWGWIELALGWPGSSLLSRSVPAGSTAAGSGSSRRARRRRSADPAAALGRSSCGARPI